MVSYVINSRKGRRSLVALLVAFGNRDRTAST